MKPLSPDSPNQADPQRALARLDRGSRELLVTVLDSWIEDERDALEAATELEALHRCAGSIAALRKLRKRLLPTAATGGGLSPPY
ncbi:hypothetical protein [Chitinimonas sp.]|uniref:hypothetical protein n=1 Tax=Chitinimonas sp. TaxID=1934313 RepID=UPI002F9584B1